MSGMPRGLGQTLAGWGNLPVQGTRVYRAHRWADAAETIRQAGAHGVIARGLGRSYGDAALNDGGSVLLGTRLDRLLAFDADTGVVECESGVSFGDLLRVFVPRGYFPPVTPGTKHVTMGGAIAADVHGKNHHRDGSFAAHLLDLRLLTASGEILTCSRAEHADAFWATCGGMGLTGMIMSARIRLRPVQSSFLLVDRTRCADLDQALEQFEKCDRFHQYSVAWIDCLARGRSLGRTVLMHANHAAPDQLPSAQRAAPLAWRKRRSRNVPVFAPGFMLNRWSVGAFNAVYYAAHPAREAHLCHFEPFFYPLDALGSWNRIYGRRGFIQYQVAFEPAHSRAGLIAVLDAIAASGRTPFLAVLKAFGQASGGMLSFPRAGYTLALDIPNHGTGLAKFAGSLNRVTLAHGGRVYLAKDAFLDAESFASMYPDADGFRAVKRRLDPSQRFSSSLARRIGLTG
jgi:decaprenylphospho-beta-D-ribofuranose 2-oxidase